MKIGEVMEFIDADYVLSLLIAIVSVGVRLVWTRINTLDQKVDDNHTELVRIKTLLEGWPHK